MQSQHDLLISPNLLAQVFSIDRPNAIWVSDITYIGTDEGWLYLDTTLDLFSRNVVRWAMESHTKTDLVLASLSMAVDGRNPGPGVRHHSNRESQFSFKRYQESMEAAEMVCRMSREPNSKDNTVQENIDHTLKTELVSHELFKTRAEVKAKVFEYIEVFGNRERLHSSLGHKASDVFTCEHVAA
jgi:putative transposase